MGRDWSVEYYGTGGVAAVDYIRAKLTPEEFRGWCKGNIIKYVTRAGLKPGQDALSDLQKADSYLLWAIQEEQRVVDEAAEERLYADEAEQSF